MCYDPLITEYLNITTNLLQLYPPATGAVLPENMPGFRGPRISSPDTPLAIDVPAITAFAPSVGNDHCVPVLTAIYLEESGGHHHVPGNISVHFGQVSTPLAIRLQSNPKVLQGHDLCVTPPERLLHFPRQFMD